MLIACENIGKGYSWRGEIPPGFSRRFGTLGYDYGWNAASSPFDGGIIIVGERASKIGGQSDVWAIKTDARGIMQWEKSFGGCNDCSGFRISKRTSGKRRIR